MTRCLDDSVAGQSEAPESQLEAEAFTDMLALQRENVSVLSNSSPVVSSVGYRIE